MPASPKPAPVRPASLRRNFGWAFLGNMAIAGSAWGMLVLLAKFRDEAAVGELALAFAWVAPIFMLSNAELRATQASDADRRYPFGSYWRLRLLTGSAAVLSVALLLALAEFSSGLALSITFIALGRFVEGLLDILYGAYERQQVLADVGSSQVLRSILMFLCFAAGVYFGDSVAMGCLGWTVGTCISAVSYDLPRARKVLREEGGRELPKGAAKALLRLTFPLGLAAGVVSLNGHLPRYILEAFTDQYEVGRYSATVYLMQAATLVSAAMTQSALPRLAQYWSEKKVHDFRQTLGKLLLIALGLGALGMLVVTVGGELILEFFYRAEYRDLAPALVILMAAGAFIHLGGVLRCALTASRHFGVQLPVFTGVSVVITLALLALVPSGGVMGAAYAVLIAAVFRVLVLGLALARAFQRRGKG